MVKIIDGEIVQDDDPRLQQRATRPAVHRQTANPATQSTTPAGGFNHGFDWNAPACKVVQRPDAAGGIPDVELYGLKVPGVGVVGVAAAGAFFGLRGLLAAAVLGYLYLRSSAGAFAATSAGPSAAAARGAGMFMARQQQQGASSTSQQHMQQGQGQADKPGTAFKGKAYKLSRD